jgi:penicillin-binding protein 1A
MTRRAASSVPFALERREVVNYDGFAPVLRQAVISIEDKSFESHWGINVLRIAGALWHDLRSHGRAQGASTLTMQLARNLFLSSERTVHRKVQEAYLAIQIERAFTKQQIFTLYGNQIYLGSGMYGFEAASQFYFSKHARISPDRGSSAGRVAQGSGGLLAPPQS